MLSIQLNGEDIKITKEQAKMVFEFLSTKDLWITVFAKNLGHKSKRCFYAEDVCSFVNEQKETVVISFAEYIHTI